MENLEQIKEYWKKDVELDQTEPGKELIKIPLLHSKYLNILTEHKFALKKAHFEYVRLKKIKQEYYGGKLSEEELKERGWEPFQYILKTDISSYLESDEDLIKLLMKKIYHEEVVSFVESIMSELKQRSWQLKSFIQWEMFIAGQ